MRGTCLTVKATSLKLIGASMIVLGIIIGLFPDLRTHSGTVFDVPAKFNAPFTFRTNIFLNANCSYNLVLRTHRRAQDLSIEQQPAAYCPQLIRQPLSIRAEAGNAILLDDTAADLKRAELNDDGCLYAVRGFRNQRKSRTSIEVTSLETNGPLRNIPVTLGLYESEVERVNAEIRKLVWRIIGAVCAIAGAAIAVTTTLGRRSFRRIGATGATGTFSTTDAEPNQGL